jgi:CRP-like cAMP-binding protein
LAVSPTPVPDAERWLVDYRPGQIVFHEGNRADTVYCVASGCVKLLKSGARGEPLMIRVLGQGELLGYRAVLAEEPYAVTAEAAVAVTLCAFSRATFLDLARQSSTFASHLLKRMARELRISEEQLVSIAREPVRQRTARLLLLLRASQPKSEISIDAPLSRGEIRR